MRIKLFIIGLVILAGLLGSAAPGTAHAVVSPLIVVRAFSDTGGTPTAADNDYTRINSAIQGLSSGDTIKLIGTFDWTEANAAASWAKGSDGIASNADDYEITVPTGKNNVTLTSSYLGAATIQGPGDLPGANLEGFLDFEGGPNQNWTISNLRIQDFDLGIGMFNGAGGSTAFNGTKIINNYIRVPNDLNAVAASADVNQNIGIHYSFGQNQTIANNTIEFPGDGVSDGTAPADFWTFGVPGGANFSSNVGMQSNTSGGNIYDGLLIDHNTFRVLNAQSANPAKIIGLWENGHAHNSNITISNNQFINLAVGNNPATNRQIAFRPTSHSSGSTTVQYLNNSVQGASIGFGPMDVSGVSASVMLKNNSLSNVNTGFLLGGNESFTFINNTLANAGPMAGLGTGISVPATAVATIGTAAGSDFISGFATGVSVGGGAASLNFTKLTGNGTGLAISSGTASGHYSNISGNSVLGVNNTSGVAVDFTKNWWGSDTGPVVPNNGVSALVTTNPFAVALASTVTASTHEIGETGTLDTNITVNNLYGAQLRVSHDNTVLAFQPFPTSIHNDVGGFFWDIVSENFVSVSSPTGVRLSGSMGAGAPYNHPTPANLSGQSIATWKYNCTSAGTSTLMYDNTAGFGTLLANKSGGNLSAALIGDSISCTAATASSVDGFIKLQGRIGGAASPAGWNSAVVTLTCTGGACIGSGPYNFPATDINGHYQIIKVGPGTGVALGTYSASVVRRAYLGATKGTPVTVSGPTTIDLVGSAPTLLGGDVTGDNAVGIGDLTAIGGSFGNTVTADTGSDINGDGFVNIFDLVLAGGNYGTSTSLWP